MNDLIFADRLPEWPSCIPRVLKPIARLRMPKDMTLADMFSLEQAKREQRKQDAIRCSAYTQTWSELLFKTTADGTPVASTASETTLLPANVQPVIPANFFTKLGQSVRMYSRGIFSNTGTPTMTFQLRMGATVGTTTYSGTSIGVTSAIGTTSTVTNVMWEMMYDLENRTDSASGSGNTTLSGAGFIRSPAGFAAPYAYSLIQAAGSATWTWTIQSDVQNYVNFSLTWGTSNASNTCTLKSFKLYGEN